jgi:hypothetical protein
MSSEDDRWTDEDAGPVSRPYTVTGGRTRPRGARHFALLDVVARSTQPADFSSVGPERARILDLCLVPVAVADLASAIGLPLGVVDIRTMAPRGRVTDNRLLQKVLDGLHAL